MANTADDGLAFSWFSAGSYFGMMGGAAVGGYLAEPNDCIPVIGSMPIFDEHPYILPGIFLCVCSILASVGVLLFVPEVMIPVDTTSL